MAIEPYLQWLHAAGEENVLTEKDDPDKMIFDYCHVFKNICDDISKYDIRSMKGQPQWLINQRKHLAGSQIF